MRFQWFVAVGVLALLAVSPVVAEGDDTGWSSTAEAGFVVTSGNSDTETLSFKDTTVRKWEGSSLSFKLGAIRSETTTTSRIAEQLVPLGPITIIETDSTATNAEAYYFSTRFDKEISEKFFWFAGAGWDQNKPSGIDSRVTAFAGVGNIWRDDDKVLFRTDYALSFTDQEDVVPTATSVNDYAGLRASWVYQHQLTESTRYSNDLIVDFNLDETDAWRADMINSVAVALSKKLALQVSLQHLYNNLPPSQLLTVVDGTGTPVVPAATVPFELDELDTIFSTSLVVNF